MVKNNIWTNVGENKEIKMGMYLFFIIYLLLFSDLVYSQRLISLLMQSNQLWKHPEIFNPQWKAVKKNKQIIMFDKVYPEEIWWF